MSGPPINYRKFAISVLEDLYAEQPSLMSEPGFPPRRGRPPRSTERAIVGRMAIHAHPWAALLDGSAVVDFEYERVGVGRVAKRMAGRKISPDLIVHARGTLAGNFMAIEVKRAGHRKQRAWLPENAPPGPASEDFRKLHFFTHHLEAAEPPGMKSYRWGLYLEFDELGADSWWIPRGKPTALCDTQSFNCDYPGKPEGPPAGAIYERLP
jgi:hypothetical protein